MLDFTQGTLANRATAGDSLAALYNDLATQSGNTVVVCLGQNIATVSWLDGFVGTLATRFKEASAEGKYVIVLCELEDTLEHVQLVLERKGVAAFVVRDREELSAGKFGIVGAISESSRETFSFIERFGCARVSDLATALDLTVEATQQRLNELLELRLVERERDGKAYLYHLPVFHIEEKLLTVA